MILENRPRVAFADLTFNWPPVGGCWVDLHHVMMGLQNRGAKVKLFCPDFGEYYPRGDIRENLPYPVETIPFNRYTFNFHTVKKRFRRAVEAFEPDLVFIGDGYHMKSHLLEAFGPERCLLRFYSYEMMCINLHYFRYHENRICDYGFFEDPAECRHCWFRRMPAWGRAVQIALGMRETHPKLHFSQEYLASLAFTRRYRESLIRNFKELGGAVVYNEFMRSRLAPYVDTISVIPSGVDAARFKPPEQRRDAASPARIFLPGRANDPLKGMDTLIGACRRLAERGADFEVHYTAAMDCPAREPWLINRGWVGQDDLARLYGEMDIVVVPSLWIEPFGITALEGMASGLPVVASRIGGLAGTVGDGETGFHFEPGNEAQLADILAKLIDSPELRTNLGRAGRERVLGEYSWPVILDRHYVPLVESMAANARKRLVPA